MDPDPGSRLWDDLTLDGRAARLPRLPAQPDANRHLS
jgi:hypothetical protein